MRSQRLFHTSAHAVWLIMFSLTVSILAQEPKPPVKTPELKIITPTGSGVGSGATMPPAPARPCDEQPRQELATDPASSRAHAALGWCHLNTGKFDDAIAAWQQAFALIPAWIKEYAAQNPTKSPKLSKEQIEDLQRHAYPLSVLFNIGWAYHKAQRYEEALQAYQQIPSASALSVQAEEAAYQKALIHLARGDRTTAMAEVNRLGRHFVRRLDVESTRVIPALIPPVESVSSDSPPVVTTPTVRPLTPAERPTIIYKERARYTEEARAANMQGTVMLSVIYRSDGRLIVHHVVRELPYGLTMNAIEAAEKIRFQPAQKDGKPISVQNQVEFNFTIY